MTDDRAIGLGACDIKGAAACLLAAARGEHRADVAFLFTSDEEANDARCVASFLKRDHGFTEAIIAEPTNAQAVLAHRGIASVRMAFKGQAGHASAANALELSAVHQAMRWGTRALDHVASLSHLRFGGLTGLRFNIGRIEGGIKGNVIAPSAELRFGFRPLPSQDLVGLHATFRSLADPASLAAYEETFQGPCLPSGDIAPGGSAAPAGARPGRCARPADRQRSRFLDRGRAFLRCRPDRASSTAPATSPRRMPPTSGWRSINCVRRLRPTVASSEDRTWRSSRIEQKSHGDQALYNHGMANSRQLVPRSSGLLSNMAQRQGDPAVPEALLAARRRALRGGEGRRRHPARRTRCAGVLAARSCSRWG